MGEIEKNNLNQLEAEITILKHQTAQNIIEIGRRLVKAKELVPYGEWGLWLENKVDFSQSMANKFMKVAMEFSDSESIPKVGLSKLIMLTTVDPEERETFIEENPVEDMTTRELKQAIKEKKELEKKIEELENQEPTVIEKEKVVEVIPGDYQYFKDSTEKLQKMVSELINKSEDYKYNLEKLEKEKNILERKARLNEEDSKKYKNLKDQIEKLSQQKDDLGRQIKARTELSGLVVRVEHLLKTELAPIKYSRAIHEASEDKIVVNNLRDIVGRVQDWCNEMSRYLPMKNYGEVIEVEVIEHE